MLESHGKTLSSRVSRLGMNVKVLNMRVARNLLKFRATTFWINTLEGEERFVDSIADFNEFLAGENSADAFDLVCIKQLLGFKGNFNIARREVLHRNCGVPVLGDDNRCGHFNFL